MTTNRIEAFSDGVFAIAITLLVLGVRIPHAEDNQLARELLRAWPSLVSYVLAFVIVGLSWASHHAMLRISFEWIAGLCCSISGT